MQKGISYFFGYSEISKEQRAELIKDGGFDCVITSQDERFNEQNGDINFQVELFKRYGLKLSSLHNQYITSELPNFWLDNEIGDKLERNLIKDLETAKQFGFKCVVVHMMGTYNEIGKERLKRVLSKCEELDVPIAIENIDYQHPFIDIFENFSSPYLKFCYDSGHNNCFDKEFNYLEKYGDKLICLHLHDNDGTADQHTLARFGTIDWENIAKNLAKLDLTNVSLDYEMLMKVNGDLDAKQCIQETKKMADKLESAIKKYQNQ